jgi:hypothetical protein
LFCSIASTLKPLFANSRLVMRPAGPAPTTITPLLANSLNISMNEVAIALVISDSGTGLKTISEPQQLASRINLVISQLLAGCGPLRDGDRGKA